MLILACGCIAVARGEEIFTLIRAYDAAWDRGDLKAMYDMLDPECVFKSPFQMRIGREEIRDHLFQNTKRFRDTVSVEELSKIDGDIAYTWGYRLSTTTLPTERSNPSAWPSVFSSLLAVRVRTGSSGS